MKLFDLETYTHNQRLIGIIAIVISIAAWTVELLGWAYVCPFCRMQRSVIGILGVMLRMPNPQHWISRYIGTVLGALAVVVAATQHFGGWKKISAGTFEFREHIYFDPFLLSGAALFIIVGLVFLLFVGQSKRQQ